ncbi:M1 family metallopeptidase [Paraflavitalea sp. CAU 1676]|uniref:M1 family metallopeptidase n=1 Tax=Paraflavitalea sp. CAU 1676 TaxID=3032598 RepID=UPI0023DA35A8|nr:M1 family metallopeptidase [Paraflavitalea sp. CAU 1676]MDF2190015.1 M1 family metallopeptidase [Paraflavitalea sp. CAU 1676]
MYKKIVSLLILILSTCALLAQDYWQQEVHYNIDVALNEKLKSLDGKLQLKYINRSPDTLTYIWFHLWPNAYKDNTTALARQLSADKEGRKKLKNKKSEGFMDGLAFTVDGKTAVTMPDTAGNPDVIKVLLPAPLMPGQTASLATPFQVKLPYYFSRSGYDGDQYMICQWYPKPAVYDKKGWHPIPYLDQGEFYSEFGSFSVNITVPAEYIVGATGSLLTKDELERYKSIGAQNYQARSAVAKYQTDKPGTTKTLQYVGENIHDFAWFADKDVVIQYDTLQLPSGKIIDAFAWYQPNGNVQWGLGVNYIKDAIRKYSGWIGEYPWPVAQAVEGPKNLTSGGMEYPMITLITSPEADAEGLDAVITHEVGHNWFYGILGSNERDHPWMDEGINSFYQFRYEAEKYKSNSIFGKSLPKEIKALPAEELLSRVYNALNSLPAKEPVNTGSTGFANKNDYGIVVYVKAATWLYLVQMAMGRENFDKAMQEYFSTWKFKHPYPEDLKTALEKATGSDLSQYFELLNKEGNF